MTVRVERVEIRGNVGACVSNRHPVIGIGDRVQRMCIVERLCNAEVKVSRSEQRDRRDVRVGVKRADRRGDVGGGVRNQDCPAGVERGLVRQIIGHGDRLDDR